MRIMKAEEREVVDLLKRDDLSYKQIQISTGVRQLSLRRINKRYKIREYRGNQFKLITKAGVSDEIDRRVNLRSM